MNQTPAVGIVVCTYERPDTLRRALNVLASQTYSPHIVVVVDDGSSLAAENRRVVAQYPGDIDYILNSSRHGITATRNRGLQQLIVTHRPDIVTMLDDDDYWPTDRLAHGVRVMTDQVGMSYGIQWMTDEKFEPHFKYPSKTTFTRALAHALLFGEFTFPAKTLMFQRRFLEELRRSGGEWYAPVDSREDVELGIRALRHARRNPHWKIVFSEKLLACWVQKSPEKYFSPEHVRRQQAGHELLVREYFSGWLQWLALRTAPYAIRMPDWVRHAIV